MSLVSLPNCRNDDVISRERNRPSTPSKTLCASPAQGYERYRRTREIDTHFDEKTSTIRH
jgi:N utilization substance protein A